MEYFSTGVTKDKLMVLHGLKALGMQPPRSSFRTFSAYMICLGISRCRTPRMSWRRKGL